MVASAAAIHTGFPPNVEACAPGFQSITLWRAITAQSGMPLAIPFATSAQDAFTTRSVNVRAGPDTSYPPVATLGGGAPVQVMGCLDDWSWCDVAFEDNRGWVYAPYLSYVYQGARVPFYTYAPSFGIPIIGFSVGSYWDRYYRGRPWYGRRDYWERRAPQHARPSGPAPRGPLCCTSVRNTLA